jgi:hypothetical protein
MRDERSRRLQHTSMDSEIQIGALEEHEWTEMFQVDYRIC